MQRSFDRELLATLLCVLLIVGFPCEVSVAQQPQGASPPSSSSTRQGVPLSEQELDNLVSPIALYPDALVAQILAASTFPDQAAVADNWLQQNESLTGGALMQAVNGQSWDPSVKALTQFPSVSNNMAQNLAWTSQLGEAYHNQQSQIMSAIQTLRQQAKPAGNLKNTPQQTVGTQSQGGQQVIVIQPATPQVVYILHYNPTVVYGAPYTAPGYIGVTVVVVRGPMGVRQGAGVVVGVITAGKQNGLYWPLPEGQPRSPLGPLLAYASAQGFQVKPDSHQPFYGYFFQMLDKQGPDAKGGTKNYIVNGKMTGGFAVLAYTAQSGDSGIMAFIINQNGVVLEKDLGKTTDQVAAQITAFDLDKSWRMVE